MNSTHPDEPSELGKLLLQSGIALLKAGASSNRIITNLKRFANVYGYEAIIDLNTKNISLTLYSGSQEKDFSGAASLETPPGANFRVISAISSLSWDASKKNLSLSSVSKELKNATDPDDYHRLAVLGLVGLAGASFCYTFGGSLIEMAVAFLATVTGLFLKQEMLKRKFNTYVITYSSAVISALIVGIFWKLGINSKLDHAFATCTLFLIPGVPLINSFIDLLDGYIINGLDRGINASIHAFGIAAGLATILYIFNVHG